MGEERKNVQIRLWRLGSKEFGITPSHSAFVTLRDCLAQINEAGGGDIIWDAAIEVAVFDVYAGGADVIVDGSAHLTEDVKAKIRAALGADAVAVV